MLDFVLDRLAAAGVERAVVNVHYLADQIERHLASRKKPQIVISDERAKLLNTGGGVVKALPELGREPFFHVNSDTIWIDGVKPNLTRLAEAFDLDHGRAAAAGAGRRPASAMPGAATSPMAPDGRLRSAANRRSRLSSMPARRCCAPELFDGAPADAFSLTRCSTGARGRPAARAAARRRVDACRHAGRHRAGRGGDPGQHGLDALPSCQQLPAYLKRLP